LGVGSDRIVSGGPGIVAFGVDVCQPVGKARRQVGPQQSIEFVFPRLIARQDLSFDKVEFFSRIEGTGVRELGVYDNVVLGK